MAQPSIVQYADEEELKSISEKTQDNLIDKHNPAEVKRKAMKPGDDDYIYFVEQQPISEPSIVED